MVNTKLIVALITSLVLVACGGTERASAPQPVASAAAAPVPAAPAPMARPAVNTFFSVIASAADTTPHEPAALPVPAAAAQVDAARLLAWEQSYSLEMHRQHQEQQARVTDSIAQEGS